MGVIKTKGPKTCCSIKKQSFSVSSGSLREGWSPGVLEKRKDSSSKKKKNMSKGPQGRGGQNLLSTVKITFPLLCYNFFH